MATSSNNSTKDADLARRMFFGGCAALPFLWFVNVLFYRKQVFGEISWWDKTEEQGVGHESTTSNDMVNDSHNEDAGAASDGDDCKLALQYWVKRSFYSCILVTSLFITWILVFQLNKDSFGKKWFVVDVANPTDRTGW
mmetsp:Transcript_16449/g.15880  ORF Transcript_16449/g.15880 Transcript_16449/m.15880 type:complete len:139 (-) Transcript_16449:201-617(-)